MNRRNFVRSGLVLLSSQAGLTNLFAAGWKGGEALPSLGEFGLEGSLPNLKGKVLYLDFWASWCAPCKASFPILDKWQHQYGAQGFSVVGVNVDDLPADMQRFLAKRPVSFPIVRDPGHKLVAAANVATLPTSFLVDRRGIVRQVHNGFRPQDEPALAALITSLLAKS